MRWLIFPILLAVILIFSTLIFLMPARQSGPLQTDSLIRCSVIILSSPPITASFPKGTTALEATRRHTKVIAKGDGANAFIIEINGRRADPVKQEFWNLRINGKPAAVGAGSYVIQDHDTIEWSIATY